MASLPNYRASPEQTSDLVSRVGGLSMNSYQGHGHHQPPSNLSPIPSSLGAAINTPLPPSTIPSHHASPAVAPVPPPLSPTAHSFNFYPGHHIQQAPPMPMNIGMEPPFSPVLAAAPGFGFAGMQVHAQGAAAMVHDQQSQYEFGLGQGGQGEMGMGVPPYFGHGQLQEQGQVIVDHSLSASQPFFPTSHQVSGESQHVNNPVSPVLSSSGPPNYASTVSRSTKGNTGMGPGNARWPKDGNDAGDSMNHGNRFAHQPKSPGRQSYKPPQRRFGDLQGPFTPNSGYKGRGGGGGGRQAFAGAWATPPSLASSDRSADGTPNSSFPNTPRSRPSNASTLVNSPYQTNNKFNGGQYDLPRSYASHQQLIQFSPNNPYAASEQYYNNVAPGGYGYMTMRGSGGMGKGWRRFDHEPKSALLEEFRTDKSHRQWGLKDIAGHVIEFSGDQAGSRLIQEKIEYTSEHDRQAIFDEIRPNALTLMTDVYGNYVIQKFVEHGNNEQRRFLVEQMYGRVLALSNQMYGCRVIQTALDHADQDQRLILIGELRGQYLECIKSANANHVIQRIVLNDPPQYVLDSFLGHIEELSLHTFGCRVLQKALETLPRHQQRPILDELHKSVPLLIEDAFGNYVIQSVIEAGLPEDRDKVIAHIKRKIFAYSRHKFASNVVEKAIRHSNADDRRDMVYELVFYRNDGFHRVPMLLKDSFANFVFQTCLLHAERQQRQQLLDLLAPLLPTLTHTPVGKRIAGLVSKMETDEGFHIKTPSTRVELIRNGSNGTGAANTLHPHPHGRQSPISSDGSATERDDATEVGTVVEGGRYDAIHTPISSPTPGYPADREQQDDSSGSSGTGGRELRPTASAPPRSDASDNWRFRTWSAGKKDKQEQREDEVSSPGCSNW